MTDLCTCPTCHASALRLGLTASYPADARPAPPPLPRTDLVAALTERITRPVPVLWPDQTDDETNVMALSAARSRQAREAEAARREAVDAHLRTFLASLATRTPQPEPPACHVPPCTWPPAMPTLDSH